MCKPPIRLGEGKGSKLSPPVYRRVSCHIARVRPGRMSLSHNRGLPNKKGRPVARPPPSVMLVRSAFRELEAAAGLGAAVFLAFDDARVAGQEAGLLHLRPQRRLVAGESGSDAEIRR